MSNNVWKINCIILCLYQHTLKVNWWFIITIDSCSIKTILKQHADVTFFQNTWELSKILYTISIKSMEAWVFFGGKQIHNWFCSSMLADRSWQLTVKAMNNHTILISKGDVCEESIHIEWRYLPFFMILDLLETYIFTRLMRLWYWYHTFSKC